MSIEPIRKDIAPRGPGAIIGELLEWRHPMTERTLENHIEYEAGVLRDKLQEHGSSFAEFYQRHSGEDPKVVLKYAEEAAQQLRAWRANPPAPGAAIPRDEQQTAADTAEFVLVPFLTFTRSIIQSMGFISSMFPAEVQAHFEATGREGDANKRIISVSQRTEQMGAEYRDVCQLYVELCDRCKYPIVPQIRHVIGATNRDRL